MRNKKGIDTGLVDFFSTTIIVLIIVIFFFAVKLKTEKVTNTTTGEELGIDATRIALLYAQTPVETSKGTMTFGKFIGSVAADAFLEEEFSTLTNEFFNLQMQTGASLTITLTQNDNEKELVSIENYAYRNYVDTAQGEITVPLQKPGDFAIIIIQTNIEE